MRLIDADTLPISFDGHTVSVWKKDLDAAPTVNPYEWISVEDRLPEPNKNVLVYAFYHGRWQIVKGWYSILFKKFHICNSDYQGSMDVPVTHWIPLPSPPTEKENRL